MEHALRRENGLQAREVELRNVDLATNAVGLCDQRVDLADDAHLLAVDHDIGAAAGMIARVLGVGDIGRRMHVQLVEDRVDLALEREEVLMLAVGAEDHALGLVGQLFAVLRQIDLANLIELHALVLEREVAGEDIQHAGQDDRAHDGGIFAQGVHELDGPAQRAVGRDADGVE